MKSNHPATRGNSFFRALGRLILVLILSALPLAGTADDDITLRVWIMGGEAELIPQLAAEFEQQNPGVKIRIQSLSWGGSYEKLVTAFLGGTPPDVCQLGTTMMHDFYAMGALENLQPLFSAGKPAVDDFFAEPLKTCSFNGGLYGIPWYVDTRVVFYRREMLEKHGWNHFPRTWDEFFKLGEQVMAAKRAAGDTIGYFASLQGFTFEMYYWQAGGSFAPLAPGRDAFEEAAMTRALTFNRRMKRAGFLGKPQDSGLDYITEFDQGTYEVAISGPWMASDLKKNQHRLKNSWAMATMPADRSNTSFIGGANLVQFKESRHKEVGRKFILFLSSPETQARWYQISSDIPANRRAMALPELANDPVMKVFREQLASTKLPPPEREWSIFWERFYKNYEEFFDGDEDPLAFTRLMNSTMAGIVAESEKAKSPQTGSFYWLALSLFPLLLAFFYVVGPPGRHLAPSRAVLAFLAPAVIILLVFRMLPLCVAFAASFTDLGATSITDPTRAHILGAGNYLRLYQDQVFWKSVKNTAIYLVVGVPFNLLIALGLALAINRFRGWKRHLIAVCLFLPSVVTTVASAVTWRWIYCQQSPVNIFINWLGLGPINWLGEAEFALPALIVFSVWRSFGLSMIIILAAMELISSEQYEAVRIDGGSAWDEFRHVTLPGLRRTLFAVMIGSIVANIQFFIEPYVLTGGGPKDETLSLLLFSYNKAFGSFQLGYASAVINVLFVFFVIFNLWQNHMRKKLDQ